MIHTIWTGAIGALSIVWLAGGFCGTMAQGSEKTDAAKPDAAKPDAAEQELVTPEQRADLEAIEEEFRELVCSRASDETYPHQETAINLALSQQFTDTRFDALVRTLMRTAIKPGHWDVDQVARAERLLPLTTLSQEEKTELVFWCYLASGDSNRDRELRNRLYIRLRKSPDQTSALVAEELAKGNLPDAHLLLARIVGESSHAVLESLMELAKSENPQTSIQAMSLLPNLIAELQRRNVDQVQAEEWKQHGGKPDSKLLVYANRIISKYDRNGDGKLTPDEYESMLVSPAKADLDGDGAISAAEYAAWMQARMSSPTRKPPTRKPQ